MRDATSRQLRVDYIRCPRCNALIRKRVYGDHEQAHRQATARQMRAHSIARITTIEDAIDFLKSQGFEINHVDEVYRVRKEGWHKRPYELDAETLIRQANMIKGNLDVRRF